MDSFCTEDRKCRGKRLKNSKKTAAENKRGQNKQHDKNLIRMSCLGTDELTTFDSEETGNKLLATGRGTAETFLRPPVYRSPSFPVFFYSGIRRYNRGESRYCKDESHHTGRTLPTASVSELRHVRQLAQCITAIREKIDVNPELQILISEHLSPPTNTGIFGIITSVARFLPYSLHWLNWLYILRRKYGRHLNAQQKMEHCVIPKQDPAESSRSADSHLLHPTEYLRSRRDSSCLPSSQSVPLLSQTAESSSFEEFTPEISVDEEDETYSFQCSCPGLYQCSVTGLVFHMEGEGDVVYRTVPWNRRLLAQHHKQPAGPLFDIKCLQQSVCQLHLPHCEIRSTAGCEFLSVAHVDDEDIEFMAPHKITETHVTINITGFSAFGNVKDEDSPPDPVRALVLLFYRPPADPDPESLLNVLLLPENVMIRDVLRTRKKLVGDEIYIEMSSHCKLHPKQEYTLSIRPEDDSVLVQPTEAEFYCDNYDNYIPLFQVILEKNMKHIKLFLRDTNKQSVWERRVCLLSTGVRRTCGPSALNLPPTNRLLDVRSSFIEGISGPVLKSLLDKMFEKTVLADSERESADEIQNHRDKARFVIDTVRRKGEAASSEMIEFLCEVDPFLCEHLGLI